MKNQHLNTTLNYSKIEKPKSNTSTYLKLLFGIILFLTLSIPNVASAQTDTFKQKGIIYFKIKDTSNLNLPYYDTNYSGTYPIIQNLIDFFEIKEISKSFAFINNSYFNRVYRVKFDDYHHQNSILDSFNYLNFVEFTEFKTKNSILTVPTDTTAKTLWHVEDLKLDKAFEITTGDTNMIIAIIDGPINKNSTDLSGKFWHNSNEIPNDNIDNDNNGIIDDYKGWDFANSDNDPYWEWPNTSKQVHDKFDHGTAVATMAVGRVGNTNSTVGGCPNCKIMPVKVHTTSKYDTIITRDVELQGEYEAVAYAAKNGAKIINVSWGGWGDSLDLIAKEALTYAESVGAIIVAGAGNNNNLQYKSLGKKFFPSNSSKVISVGALKKDKFKCTFSNYPPATKVDLMAPGDNLLCGKLYGTSNYTLSSGTSLSAPLVSGIIGLIWSQHPSYSKTAIKNCLLNTCDTIEYKNFEFKGKTGNGAVNAKNAINCSSSFNPDFYTELLEQKSCTSQLINFIATKIPNGKYKWVWGDGTSTIANITTISKSYSNPGSYSIKLIATDTINGTKDSIIKTSWLTITSCKPITNNYATDWFFGKGNNLKFNTGTPINTFYKNFESYAQTGIQSTLNGDSSFVFYIRENNNSNSSTYLLKNKPRFLNNKNKIDSLTTEYLSNRNFNIPGVILPDFNSDSLLILTFPSNQLYDPNNQSNFIYCINRLGGKSPIRIAPNPPNNTTGDSTISGGYIKSSEFGCVIPHPEEQAYWLFTHPLNTAKKCIYIYKIFFDGTKRQLQFINSFNTTVGNIQEITPSPSGNYLAVKSDTVLQLYKFSPKTGIVTLHQKIKGQFKFGTCFTIKDKVLYTTETIGTTKAISQYNLNATNIANSKKIITSSTTEDFHGMQLGPDSIIYINNGYKGYIGAIGFPEVLNTGNYTNECGQVDYAKDLNTTTPLKSRDTTINSGLKLPCYVFQNLPQTIKIQVHQRNCTSAILTSNFPARIFQKWVVNGKAYTGPTPTVDVKWDTINKITLFVDSSKWTITPNLKDSAYVPAPEINNNIKSIRVKLNTTPTKLYISNTFYNGFNKIKWYRNGAAIDSTNQTDTIYIETPGVYHVMGISDCGARISNRLEINWDCSDSKLSKRFFKDTGKIFSTGVYSINDSFYILSGDNRIISGVTLQINNSHLVMAPGSKITVQPGGKLIIDNTQISGCSTWKGIEIIGVATDSTWRNLNSPIHGNANITNSTISDAFIGIKTSKGGFLSFSNNTMYNNGLHIVHNYYKYRDYSIVNSNTFKMVLNSEALKSVLDSIYLAETKTISRIQCLADSMKSITYSYNSFQNIGLLSEKDLFVNKYAIFTNRSSLFNISNNSFYQFNNNATIAAINCTNLNINNNSIISSSTYGIEPIMDTIKTNGIRLKNTTLSSISNNYFNNVNVGFGYYLNTPTPVGNTDLNNNSFVDVKYAIAAATDTFPVNLTSPINNYTNTIYLQTKCNTIDQADIAFVACGKIIEQGSSTYTVGNKFYNCLDTVYWYNSNNIINYFYFKNSTNNHKYHIPCSRDTISTKILINGIKTNQNDCEGQNTNKNPIGCSFSPEEMNSMDLIDTLYLQLAPNPTIGSFKILTNNRNLTYYQIHNTIGELIETNKIMTGKFIGENLMPGIYIIKTFDNYNKNLISLKLIKLE